MQSYNALIGILHPGVESFSEIQHYGGGGKPQSINIVKWFFKNEDHNIIPMPNESQKKHFVPYEIYLSTVGTDQCFAIHRFCKIFVLLPS